MPTSSRQFKDAIFEQFARLGKALAAPKRLELLELLSQGPRTVEVLASLANVSVANASQHLQVLRAARLVEAEKRGLYVQYRLADDQVARFCLSLRELAEARLAEVEEVTRSFLEEREVLEAIDGDELLARVRRGDVTVIDVRPREEFQAGHIPGALSVPLGELQSRLADLPTGRPVVAYCRGPYCVLAVEAVARLRKQGWEAHRLELGVVDWRARGWNVEVETRP
ncbi:MAG: metalloregulator ArsR/SmtB family transcription factor [Deltaproteobacteria bacterium]|nr:metalloregulator ArsR/SmtB family transcription factor [Deltaproteobacteria bacterium]